MLLIWLLDCMLKKAPPQKGHSAAASCVDNLWVTSRYRSQLYFEGRFSYQCM